MALVLFTFSDSLFISNHSVMLFNSVFIASIFVFLFSVLHNVVSSAYILGLWLRLECSLDSLSIDSAHVIYVSEGYDVAYNRRTASQPSYVVLRVTWYVKTFRNVNYVC